VLKEVALAREQIEIFPGKRAIKEIVYPLRHTLGSSAESFGETGRGKWLNYDSKTIQSKSSFLASESKKRPVEERQLMLFITGFFV